MSSTSIPFSLATAETISACATAAQYGHGGTEELWLPAVLPTGGQTQLQSLVTDKAMGSVFEADNRMRTALRVQLMVINFYNLNATSIQVCAYSIIRLWLARLTLAEKGNLTQRIRVS